MHAPYSPSKTLGLTVFRVKMIEAGLPQTTPSLSRPTILELVKAMWSGIDHARVASKGYRQTGPELPMEGLGAPAISFLTS